MHFLGKFKWSEAFVLAHNTMFDGAILSWKFGIKPMAWLDTLCMARATDGLEVGNSLAKLAERYNLGVKGNEVVNAMGKRRAAFSDEDLSKYGDYCRNDVDLTYALFQCLAPKFTKTELKLIDLTLRMFTEPVLELDLPSLEQHLEDVKDKKEKLMAAAESDRDTLMSNDKFAALLQSIGVVVPTKISLTTGKEAWALAKSDEGLKELQEHEDLRVQALVAARLGTKSTLEETRTTRFIGIAKRGNMPVPLRYYAAHTGRWGGDDKLNLQNLPRSGRLKQAIIPPDGYVIINADSSQIEARTVAWLAGQTDLVEAF
jgi:DNA polymerase